MTAVAEQQAPGTGNTLTVKATVCDCSRASLDIEIDGSVVGTVGCGEDRSFTITSGTHTVKIYSATLEHPLRVTATANELRGTLIRISCA